VSGRFGVLDVRLDQSRGDTCHHWKGDTWHGMTSAAYVADDVSIVRQVTWQRRVAVTWANQRWTRGIFWLDGVNESAVDTWHALIGCKGATWPNHGLPCGTLGFANIGCVKNLLGPRDSNPGPPTRPTPSQISASQHSVYWFL
jgi:hypothetical protein